MAMEKLNIEVYRNIYFFSVFSIMKGRYYFYSIFNYVMRQTYTPITKLQEFFLKKIILSEAAAF